MLDDRAWLRTTRTTRLVASLVVLSFFVMTLLWFITYRFRTLMGDDIYLLDASNTTNGYASSFLQAFTQGGSDKYRPVLAASLSVILDAFGGNFLYYQLFNAFLLSILCSLAGLIAYRLSRGSYLAAVLAGVAIALSRFNLYYVLQVYGIMENLALGFVLTGVLAAERAYSLANRRYLYASFAVFGLSIFTHERYMILVAFFVAVALFAPIPRTRTQRLVDCAAPLGVLFLNYALKVWILHVHFFTGGGGTSIKPKSSEIMWFTWRAILNSLGYNSGPGYLSGRNAHSLGTAPIVLSLLFALPALAVLVLAVIKEVARVGWQGTAKKLVLGATLIGPLLVSASITFRQEYRWLLGPYVALMLCLAWAVGALRLSTWQRNLVVGWFLVITACIGVYYRHYADGTYFFAGQRAADSVFDRVISQHREELATSTIFVVTHGDTLLNDWYLGNGAFFRAYAPGVPVDVRMVDDAAQAVPGPDTRPTIIVFDYRSGDRVVQIG